MDSGSVGSNVDATFRSITTELQRIEDFLVAGTELDPSILTEFRDAVNRVRHTAWAVHHYGEMITIEKGKDSNPIPAILAGERVRVVNQLCQHLQADISNPSIQLPKNELLQLHGTTQELAHRLGEVIGR